MEEGQQSIPPEKTLEIKYQLPVTKQLTQQNNNQPQSKHNEEKTKISARIECKLEK